MKMKAFLPLAMIASIVGAAQVVAQTPAPKSSAATAKSAAKADPTKQPDVGQRKFDANCGRCHSFPEQLSPSITGTVVRHMRVRANLTAQDEKDILRFLAP
jgi:cytochrome c5